MVGKALRAIGTLLIFLGSTSLFAQTPDLSKMSLRLNDWAYQHQGTRATHPVGVRLNSPVDIVAVDKQMYAEGSSLQERSQQVSQLLKDAAAATQPAFLNWLQLTPGIDLSQLQAYWVDNLLFFDATADAVLAMSLHQGVEYIDFNAILAWDEPVSMNVLPNDNAKTATPGGHEPGHDAIGATTMWAMGYTGLGRLALGIDTGVDAGHPALGYKYQGNFKPADQAWFDHSGTYPTVTDCGGSTHGTHTMGTMLGLDPNTNDTTGVAFGARWIAAPGICSGNSTAARIATFQWSMDPDGDPMTTTDMPDGICNSWYDPNTVNECNGLYQQTLDAVEAVGIAVVFSAGNSGSSPSTITLPKNINNDTVSVFCIGATEKTAPYNIAGFSSRGPSACGGTGALLIKPEVSAPGVDVRSTLGGGGYGEYSGTSMAAPHTVGAILLLKEAFPYLTGRQLKLALYYSATDLGSPGEDNDYGNGLINVPAAYQYLLNQGHVPAPYANDAGIAGVAQPDPIGCDQTVSPVITITNNGSSTLTSLPITYGVTASTSTLNWTGSLAPGASTQVSLPSMTLTPGSYTLVIQTSLPNGQMDERPYDDCMFYDFIIQPGIDFTGTDSITCGGTAQMTATPPSSGGTIQWFDQPSGGTPIFTGATYSASLTSSATYYVDVEYTDNLGAADNQIGGGGNFTNDAQYLVFDAQQDFTLNSVFVYSSTGGNRTIQLRNSGGQTLQQATINIPGGSSRITLNFNVPAGTDMQLGINGNVNLYRNNSGPAYPYEIPGVVSIKTSSAGPDYYYFFYDWEIDYNNACGREPISIVVGTSGFTPAIGQSTTTVDLSVSGSVSFSDQTTPTPTSWFWDFGNGIQNTSQNPTISYSMPGTYTVMMIVNPGSPCPDTAYTTVDVVNSVGIESELENLVEVFPNPASNRVNVRLLSLPTEQVSLTLFNALGVRVADLQPDWSASRVVPLDLTNLAAGSYFLHIRAGDETCVKQVQHR